MIHLNNGTRESNNSYDYDVEDIRMALFDWADEEMDFDSTDIVVCQNNGRRFQLNLKLDGHLEIHEVKT